MKIKELRRIRKLTQVSLGSLVGLSGAAISDYERGVSEPPIEKLLQFSRYFDVTVEELLGEKKTDVVSEPEPIYITDNVGHIQANISELYIQVPFLTARAQAGMPTITFDDCDLSHIDDSYPVLSSLLRLTERHIVIEITGDSMEPGIRSGAMVLAERVNPNDWQYESGGIYAVMYGPGRFVVKRIKTNEMATDQALRLYSDNDRHGMILVVASEIKCMWKVTIKVAEVVR